MFVHLATSRLAHIMAPRDPNASSSVAVFGLCGITTWESDATLSAHPLSRVCGLCTREANRTH